jgi:phenylpyruvate tautomerase PptA (4-oxalocrotonate tautomerase family)
VLTNLGALDRAKQLAVVEQFTEIVADAAGRPELQERTWVLLTEAPDGGWGLWDTPIPTPSSSRRRVPRPRSWPAAPRDELDASGRTSSHTPGASLTAWLRRFHAYFTSKRLVAAELLNGAHADRHASLCRNAGHEPAATRESDQPASGGVLRPLLLRRSGNQPPFSGSTDRR